MAIGSCPEEKVLKNLGVNLNKWNKIEIDENYKTSMDKIYAAGDIAGVKSTVAYASASGREAAKNIYDYLLNQ